MKVMALCIGLLAFVVTGFVFVLNRTDSTEGGGGAANLTNDAALVAAIEDLSHRLSILEKAPAMRGGERESLPELPPADSSIAELTARIARLEAQVSELRAEEALDTSGMSDEELEGAFRSAYGRRDWKVAERLSQALLERDIDDEKRGEVMSILGYAYRMLGDRDKELATFRKLVEFHGENTQAGLNAVFAVGWTLASKQNYEEGRRLMEKVIAGPESHPNMRKWARYWAANYSAKVGDTGRARQLVDGLIEEYKDAVEQNDRLILQYAETLKAEMN